MDNELVARLNAVLVQAIGGQRAVGSPVDRAKHMQHTLQIIEIDLRAILDGRDTGNYVAFVPVNGCEYPSIDSAPTDGTEILVYDGYWKVSFFDDGKWIDQIDSDGWKIYCEPTMWTYLPGKPGV